MSEHTVVEHAGRVNDAAQWRRALIKLRENAGQAFSIRYINLTGDHFRALPPHRVDRLIGFVGLAAVVFSIVLGFVAPADEASPWLYRAKVVGGVIGFMLLGVVLAKRGVRHTTAAPSAAP